MSAAGGATAVLAAFIANVGIAITKFIAFLLTQSSSMLAESIHSLADSSNQLLLLLGGKRARRSATPEHPFGFGRERYVYAFIVSVVLFSVGGIFALYEGYHKLMHPEPITAWQWVPVLVLVLAIGLETSSFVTAIRESNKVRGAASWTRFIRRAKAPELPLVLLEDLAALLGLACALVGVTLTLVTGSGLWDAAATLAIGVLLVVVALFLATETKSLLLGESASAEHAQAIEAAITDSGNVTGIISLKTMHLGPEELLIAAKVAVPPDMTAQRLASSIDAVEDRIRSVVPLKCVIYLEPDIARLPTRSPQPHHSTNELADSASVVKEP